ncbi:TonB-dependent receptor plug domain-containing protein [Ekhidna sp.]|uniref:TonB-dependent receptor n=1 Tax=Ekhidna sp. TaxID=2608089 RepID=UPI00329972D7
MIRTTRICFLCIAFFLLFSIQADCQKTEGHLLVDIIDILERRFSVSFSYADEDVDTTRLTLPSQVLTLEESLSYLSDRSNLEFHFLNEDYITITTKKSRTLCGYIKDLENDEPLINATVLIEGEIILSDSDGFFEVKNLSLTSTSEVIIRYVGYQPLRISDSALYRQDCQVYSMEPQTPILKEVMVTNYPVPGINKLAEGSFEVNTSELNILPGLIQPDVLLTIQSLPGVQSVDESVSQINIRGGSTDQTLLSWNGIRLYQYGHFFGLITAINPFLTKRVTVIKNGTRAEMGDGISGTVNIQSVNSSDQFEGEAGFNMLDADFIIKQPIASNAHLTFSARRSINDLFTSPTYDQYFDRAFSNTEVVQNSSVDSLISRNQSFQFYDWSLTFNSSIGKKSQLALNLLNISNQLHYEENEILNGKVTSRTSSLNNNSFLVGLQYDLIINPKMKLVSNSYVSSYNLESINAAILNNQRLLQENNVLDITTSFKVLHSISSRFEMTNGYQFSEKGMSTLEDINNPQFQRFKKDVLLAHAIFSESTYTTPSYHTNVKLGVRANRYHEIDTYTFEPRISVNHKLNNDLSFEILAETKSQSSTQVVDLQNDFLGVVKRQWRLANDQDIPLMLSKQLSTGLFYNILGGLLSLEAYYKVVKGITSQSQEFQNQFEFSRAIGSYKVKGLELLAKKTFGSLDAWLSYHFSHNSYRFEDLSSNDFPSNYEINHFINTGLSYTKNKFEFSTGISWNSGRPFTQPQSSNTSINEDIGYELPNDSNLPNYFRLDFSSKYNFTIRKINKAQLGISIWNLSNHVNILNSYYRLAEDNEIKRFNRRGLEITPNLSFRVWF